MAVQGHPRSVTLVPIKMHIGLPISEQKATLVLYCTISEIYNHTIRQLTIGQTLSKHFEQLKTSRL